MAKVKYSKKEANQEKCIELSDFLHRKKEAVKDIVKQL
jgi:hypothetical protein